MKKRLVIICLVCFAYLIGLAVPVLAIADPDTPPSVNAVYVYEDLLEDGDVGVLIDYYLDYTVTPDETVSEAYLAVFVDTDGTTQLKAVSPYTYYNSGYGRGLVWIYFSATEVATYSLNSASVALYRVWLTGNPTLAWAGDPPKTIASIDTWQTTGDVAVLVALRILYYADVLELAWSLDLVEITSLGNRLTALGEQYFENVITNLRIIAPACFSAGEYEPTPQSIDYTTEFGATATGTILAGTPVTLTEGTNNLNSTGAGEIVFVLEQGTIGTITGAVIAGSPVDIVAGTSTITTTGAGAFTAEMALQDTASGLFDTITGTGFDLTTLAAVFGMTRWYFSGIVWMLLSVVICAGVYIRTRGQDGYIQQHSGGMLMVLFDFCIVGGILLGLLHPIVGVLFFIGMGAFTVYVLFFKGASV